MRTIVVVGWTCASLAVGGCCRSGPCPVSGGAAPILTATVRPEPPVVEAAPPTEDRPLVWLDVSMYRLGRGVDLAGKRAGRMSGADGTALEEQWRADPSVEALAMPKVLQRSGEQATMFAGEADAAIASPSFLARSDATGIAVESFSRAIGDAVALDLRGAWKASVGSSVTSITVRETVGPHEAWMAWTAPDPRTGERFALVVRARPLSAKALSTR